jgi:hypothetical protein
MADRLVTVAVLDDPERARVAEDALRAAGIRAVVAGDEPGDAAAAGIIVRVPEEDAERAVEALDAAIGPGWDPDPDDLPGAPADAGGRPAAPAAASPREYYADRLSATAWLGILVPPVWFYAMYLFVRTAFGEGELSMERRTALPLDGVYVALGAPMALFCLHMIGRLL